MGTSNLPSPDFTPKDFTAQELKFAITSKEWHVSPPEEQLEVLTSYHHKYIDVVDPELKARLEEIAKTAEYKKIREAAQRLVSNMTIKPVEPTNTTKPKGWKPSGPKQG